VVFLTHSATTHPQPTTLGQLMEEQLAHRQHGLEVEYKGHLKDFVVISVLVEAFCNVRCFF
jgi:hypothetical protein